MRKHLSRKALLSVLLLILGVLLIRLFVLPAEAKAEGTLNIPCEVVLNAYGYGVDSIKTYIFCEAVNHEVSPEFALFIADAESGYNPWAVGDDKLLCRRTGKKQRSRGLWQINDCWNPQVSDAMAFDLVRSTNWAMPRLKNTPWVWSTYKDWLSTGVARATMVE